MRLATVSCVMALAFAPSAAAASCPARAGGGWLAVFGHVSSAHAALALQTRVRSLGWTGAFLARTSSRTYEVVLYGYGTQADVAGTQLEAQKVGIAVVPRRNLVSCADNVGVWEAVFTIEPTLARARSQLAHIRSLGFTGGAHLEAMAAKRYAVVVEGFHDVDELPPFAAEAKRAGYAVGFRPS